MDIEMSTKPGSLKFIQNQWVDVEQIADKEASPTHILLVFKNGDRIEFTWRDKAEKEYLFREFGL
jgi:ribonuclease PH